MWPTLSWMVLAVGALLVGPLLFAAALAFARGCVGAIRGDEDPWGCHAGRARQKAAGGPATSPAAVQEGWAVAARRDLRGRPPRGAYPHWWRDKLRAAGYACTYCGLISGPPGSAEHFTLHKEHDVPLSRGGEHNVANIVPSCAQCNFRKGTLTGAEFRARRAAGRLRIDPQELDRVVFRAIWREGPPRRPGTRVGVDAIEAAIARYRRAGSTTVDPTPDDIRSSLARLKRRGKIEGTLRSGYQRRTR